MRNAECGTRNDFTTLRFAHKENYMNAECRTTLFECGVRNDLIPLSLHSQGNELNAERGVRNAERLCSAELRKQGNYYIIILMSVVQRSEARSAFCVLHSAFNNTPTAQKKASLLARHFLQS